MKKYRHLFSWILIAALAVPLKAQTLRIGSKQFPESQLLAEIMAQLTEAKTPYKVERKLGMGGTLICFQALKSGDIDLYPEYSGTGLEAILRDSTRFVNEDSLFQYLRSKFDNNYGLTWLKPFGFNNTYALAVRDTLPAQTISDLNEIPHLTIGFSHEFLNRNDGWPGLQRTYALHPSEVLGISHGLAYKALANGKIDVTDAYSTDGKLMAFHLKLLSDDRHYFPAYFAAPLIRQEALAKMPKLRSVLDELAGKLPDSTMIRLNSRVESAHEPIAKVASTFLHNSGLIGEKVKTEKHIPPLLQKLWEHIQLTFIAVLLAIFIGVPLGMLITRYPRGASTVLTISGVIQTIPSLALLGFLIPLLGIGFTPAIIALFLYALLPIIRNTYSGLLSIDAKLINAARAMGMTSSQILWKLQLPLASELIMAGIRTATVINIGTATLAAFIGAGGLGEFILTGISLNDNKMVLKGAIPAALLALLADYLLHRVQKSLVPKGIRISRKKE